MCSLSHFPLSQSLVRNFPASLHPLPMLLRIILILCQRKYRLSHYPETRGTLPVDYRGFFACGLLSPALLWLTWFFLQTSPDTYYTYEPSLIFRAYRPLISICCPYC